MFEPVNTHNPFYKAGVILVVIGIIDIGYMVYCISNQISYSSSLNIFAVIAGILLMRGGVKTARAVRWLSAFASLALAGGILLLPLILDPVGLLIAQIKLNTLQTLGSYSLGVVFLVLLAWVYFQLSTPQSLAVLSDAGYKTNKPKSALYAAIVMVVFIAGLSVILFRGESAQKAKQIASEKFGSNYKYHISSMSWSGDSGYAQLTAYNSNEIKAVEVRW